MPTQTGSYNFTSNDTSYTQFSNSVSAGLSGVKRYTLLMRDTEISWISIVNEANTTATTKTAVADGLILSKIIYSAGGTEYAYGIPTSTVYDSYPFDFRYSSNCGSDGLTPNLPVYLVGTIANVTGETGATGQTGQTGNTGEAVVDGLFYLDQTTWWTQTRPSTEDGKTYIYIGNAYSTYQVWLAVENTAYQFYDGKFMSIGDIKAIQLNNKIDDSASTLNDKIDDNYDSLDGKIDDNYNSLDDRINEEVNTLNNNISTVVNGLDASLDQDEILNRLTNDGEYNGMFLENGQIYIRANYIKSETLTLGGVNDQYGTLIMMDSNNHPYGAWDSNGIRTDWFNFATGSQSATIGQTGANNISINSTSIDVKDGDNVLASFGSTTTIGQKYGLDENDEPCSLANLEMTGDRLSFKVGDTEVAYIATNADTNEAVFYMTKAIVVQDLYFGHWRWQNRSNNNLALKWMGGEE